MHATHTTVYPAGPAATLPTPTPLIKDICHANVQSSVDIAVKGGREGWRSIQQHRVNNSQPCLQYLVTFAACI